MTATIASLATLIVGYVMGSWRFQSDKMWETKNKHYQEIINLLSEISAYSTSLSAKSIPIGGIITDRKDQDMSSTVFHNITTIKKRRNIYNIFISEAAIQSIDNYLEKVGRHHFEMGEEHGMWYEGDWQAEMDFDIKNWDGYHNLAMNAIEEITREAKKELSSNPVIKVLNNLKK